jgi:preprotein translocase SecE subunit
MDRKPRIRKVETVRERAEKAELKADQPRKQPVRRVARKTAGIFSFLKVFRVLKRPLRIITYPLRPVWWLLKKLFPKYFINSFRELRQVTWPTRRETWKLTFAVLIFAVMFGLVISLADYGLSNAVKRIVLR